MGKTTFPLYIYELIQAVQKYEDEHPKGPDPEHPDIWCFMQFLGEIPEEHRKLAQMLDEVKASIQEFGEIG